MKGRTQGQQFDAPHVRLCGLGHWFFTETTIIQFLYYELADTLHFACLEPMECEKPKWEKQSVKC